MLSGLAVLVATFVCATPAAPIPGAACQSVQAPDAPTSVARISMLEFAARHRSGAVLVVDVRQETSFRGGHIPGAINVPLPDVPARLEEIRRLAGDRPVVTYCACSEEQTSALAAAALLRGGLTGARALAGGFDAWISRGGRIER